MQAGRLGRAAAVLVRHLRQRFAAVERHELFRRPLDGVNRLRQRLDDRDRALRAAMLRHLRQSRQSLWRIEAGLAARRPEHTLRLASQRHDVVAVSIFDRQEVELPDVGWITLEDAETGEWMEVDSSDAALRDAFQRQALAERAERRRLLERIGLDTIELETGKPFQLALKSFFDRRIRRAAQ